MADVSQRNGDGGTYGSRTDCKSGGNTLYCCSIPKQSLFTCLVSVYAYRKTPVKLTRRGYPALLTP